MSNQKESAAESASYYRQDPRKTTASVSSATDEKKSSNETNKRPQNFEFFTRHVEETSHPAPHALDEKLADSTASTVTTHTEDSSNSKQSQRSTPPRRSIYEWSDSDDNSEDNSRSYHGRSDSSEENDDSQDSRSLQNPSKDKDMRISSIFLDNDYSNGDIDLRLPFKPVMANYVPATEIDASITSHAPIEYQVWM